MSSILSKLINFAGNLSGTVPIANGGTASTTASAALSALGGVSSTLTSAHLLVGNGSNVATDTAVTGDVTITNAGVTAIGSSKVTSAMIVDDTIVDADINSAAAIAGSKLAAASASVAGAVTTGTQTMAGAKTWNDASTFKGSGGTVAAGSHTAAGAWTLGPGAGLTASHTIQNNSTTGSVVTFIGDASNATDGVKVLCGGTTSSTGNHLYLADNANSSASFAVRQNGQLAVRSANWGTGGTAVGVSAGFLTTSPSSRRFKENIKPLSNEVSTEAIYQLQPVVFDYKAGGHSFGFIAEDVYSVLPCLVHLEGSQPESVAYDHLAVLLLEEVKKLKTRIEELERR